MVLKPLQGLNYLLLNLGGRKFVPRTQRIHRLVANAFIPNPDNKPYVNHIDNNRHNNILYNLEWVTAYENTHHEIKTKGKMSPINEDIARNVLRLHLKG